jgi:hypothetical protein
MLQIDVSYDACMIFKKLFYHHDLFGLIVISLVILKLLQNRFIRTKELHKELLDMK